MGGGRVPGTAAFTSNNGGKVIVGFVLTGIGAIEIGATIGAIVGTLTGMIADGATDEATGNNGALFEGEDVIFIGATVGAVGTTADGVNGNNDECVPLA